jgi:benzoyl-CoA reductase/2-hydroxyglutaryl-CoA dehydratase subunit BcrC/BadD/HgdB
MSAPRVNASESIVSSTKDNWLLWKTIGKTYFGAGKIILKKRGPKILSDVKQYPWLTELADLSSFFRSVSGRSGAYRKAILTLFEATATNVVDYVVDVLDQPERVVYFQSAGLALTEILRAMGLIPYIDMAIPVVNALLNPPSNTVYMDAAESEGVSSDICSLGRSAQGLLFKGHYPKASVVIGNNGCEGQVNSSLVYAKRLGLPLFILDMPNKYNTERAEEFFAKELLRMIEWLTSNTHGEMDWDRLKEVLDGRNRQEEAKLELWEMMRLKPAPLAAEVIFLSQLIAPTFLAGLPEAVELYESLCACGQENIRKGVAANPNERYRAVVWHPFMAVHFHIYRYLELKWGVTVIQDSMSYSETVFVDTSSVDSMMRGLARMMLNTPMVNIARGTAENYFQTFEQIVDQYDINLVLVGDHIGCKSVAGMIGLLRERCRERGLPAAFIPYDLIDPRFASMSDVMTRFDQFMETVLNAEPLMETVPDI